MPRRPICTGPSPRRSALVEAVRMVEAVGVEPTSGKLSSEASTCVYCKMRHPQAAGHIATYGADARVFEDAQVIDGVDEGIDIFQSEGLTLQKQAPWPRFAHQRVIASGRRRLDIGVRAASQGERRRGSRADRRLGGVGRQLDEPHSFRCRVGDDRDHVRPQPLVAEFLGSARGEPPPKKESRAMVRPLISAVGSVHEVMRRAGPQAERDHWLANPPMELAGRVASLFRPLSPDRRGVAAVATLGTAIVVVLVALLLLFV